MVIAVSRQPERVHENSGPDSPSRSSTPPDYVRPMTPTANDVAAAIHRLLPDPPPNKMHKLLYYCQGHSLALAGQPMFTNRITADTDGPRIDGYDQTPPTTQRIDRIYTNTVVYVVSRYGNLDVRDLSRLTRAEAPWADTPHGSEITHEAMSRFFSTDGAPVELDDPRHTDPEFRRGLRQHLKEHQAAAGNAE